MNPPANWYPDPTGRHGQRYWDGSSWTEHVFTDGVQGVDPLDPDQVEDGAGDEHDAGAAAAGPDTVSGDGSVATTDVDAGADAASEEDEPLPELPVRSARVQGDEDVSAPLEVDLWGDAGADEDAVDEDPAHADEAEAPATASDGAPGQAAGADGDDADDEDTPAAPVADDAGAPVLGATEADTGDGADGGAEPTTGEAAPSETAPSEEAQPAVPAPTGSLLSFSAVGRPAAGGVEGEPPAPAAAPDAPAPTPEDPPPVHAPPPAVADAPPPLVDAPPPSAAPPVQSAPASSSGGIGVTGTLLDGSFAERESSEPATLQNSRLLRCRVTGSQTVVARQGTMVAYQGQVTFERQGAGGVGRALKRAATGEGLAMMRVTGDGDVFFADTAQHVFLLELDGSGSLSVNGRNVLAFSGDLDWDIERIKGASMLAGGLFNTTLTGVGWVALVSDGEPVVLRPEEAPTYVDVDALVAWSGGLGTRVVSTVSAKSVVGLGSGEAFQMAFDGAGVVIVQPSEGAYGGSAAT